MLWSDSLEDKQKLEHEAENQFTSKFEQLH